MEETDQLALGELRGDVMQTIDFHYKGTMIKITQKLNEVFENDPPLRTVREALNLLNKHYDYELDKYILTNVSVVLKRDDGKNFLINTEGGLDTELGLKNSINFFYPFKGG